MIPLRDIYNEARKQDDDIDIEEITNIILDSVESEFPEIVSQMDLPRRNIKLEIAKKRSRRLKREEGIRQIRNETERSNLIRSLNLIKDENSYENVTQIENEYQHPLMFQKTVDDYYSSINEFSPIKKITTPLDDVSLIPKNDQTTSYKPFSSVDIVKLAKSLSNKIIDYNLVYDKVYDRILNIEVELDAKEALELWINILDETEGDYKKSVNLEWTGEFNLTEDEYVNYSVEIMLKSNTGPRAVKGFDVIGAVKEGRD